MFSTVLFWCCPDITVVGSDVVHLYQGHKGAYQASRGAPEFHPSLFPCLPILPSVVISSLCSYLSSVSRLAPLLKTFWSRLLSSPNTTRTTWSLLHVTCPSLTWLLAVPEERDKFMLPSCFAVSYMLISGVLLAQNLATYNMTGVS